MSKMIQLRHVPDGIHRKLKARAAQEGLSLSDYLIQEVKKVAERPTPEEIRARLSRRARVQPRENAVQAIRAERESR